MQSETKEINQTNQEKTTIFLPDINKNNLYHSKGWSDNQSIYNTKIQELIKKKFEDKPINHTAIMNKYLKNNCKKYKFLYSIHLIFIIIILMRIVKLILEIIICNTIIFLHFSF